MRNVAIVGAGGVIAARHLDAIYANRGRVVAALDPSDSVGVLDRYDFDIAFFTEMERFDRHLERLRLGDGGDERVHLLTVCSPNYLHDAHTRLGLRLHADVLCEKPLVINPWNLAPLEELEEETGQRVWTVLQLREHERLVALRTSLHAESSHPTRVHDVELTYITPRGRWYDHSWKGQIDKSGGIPTNIGIHFFDLLIWLFGCVSGIRVHLREDRRMAGFLELERARVSWFLSVEAADLPGHAPAGKSYRSITVDGSEVEFSEGFGDLHTRVYDRTMRGEGYGIEDARPSIELAHSIRTARVSPRGTDAHSCLKK